MTLRRLFASCLAGSLMVFSCKGEGTKTGARNQAVADTGPNPPNESLVVTPVSHATAVLQWGGTTLYIDPVGDPAAFAAFGPADLILITDIHGDHFSLETLQQLPTEKAKLIMPQAVAEQMPDAFAPQIDVLGNGEQKERYGITVTAIPMYNLREEARDFHVKGRGNGYVLEKGGMRIYFSGDTEDIPEMRALENIDKAFVCMNLPYTMTVEQAANAVLEFAPKEVYPYHYRGRPDVSDVGRFAGLVSGGNADIRVVQLDWYPDAPY
ncbi:MBL fold metallo-hydrolase [Robiginitalea marina]|uniref:MBL fold metallo-hydrolase n=1 Tax=Robiginitalea marina TaxID=2954105 RepID=A0ABT1AVL7_9FLAO|nr:MBL fold metallo-hydrolase [Robiginitalea marina]MCO5723657.1 MBL fold metallo-hydrolase [Robiginitalea marina]